MKRVVFDTNILASSLTNREGILPTLAIAWLEGAFTLLVSDYLLDELATVWQKRYWRSRSTPEQYAGIHLLLRSRGERVDVRDVEHGAAAHAQDDYVLATARSGNADYLITGDRELLALGNYHGVQIVTPREFLAILEAAG